MALTDTAIRNAKPKAKTYKRAEGAGLHPAFAHARALTLAVTLVAG
jgi:hypothetical protein